MEGVTVKEPWELRNFELSMTHIYEVGTGRKIIRKSNTVFLTT